MNTKKKRLNKGLTEKTTAVKSKKPLFIFLGVFFGVIALYYISVLLLEGLFDSYIAMTSYLSAGLLNLIGIASRADAGTIITPTFVIALSFGCEGTEPIVIFMAAVLGFPAKWRKKLYGLLSGILILYFLNLIRIVLLYFIGINNFSLFDIFHTAVFPVIFIFIALVMFIYWMKWSEK